MELEFIEYILPVVFIILSCSCVAVLFFIALTKLTNPKWNYLDSKKDNYPIGSKESIEKSKEDLVVSFEITEAFIEIMRKVEAALKENRETPSPEIYPEEKQKEHKPTDFEAQIFLHWLSVSEGYTDDAAPLLFSNDAMLDFAEYYHKAKS